MGTPRVLCDQGDRVIGRSRDSSLSFSLVFGFGHHGSKLCDEGWEQVSRCRVEDLKVDRPVPVHDTVAKPRRLLPFDLRETSLHVDTNLAAASPSTVKFPSSASPR